MGTGEGLSSAGGGGGGFEGNEQNAPSDFKIMSLILS